MADDKDTIDRGARDESENGDSGSGTSPDGSREGAPGNPQGGDRPSAETGPAIDVDSAHDRAS